jgi:hypothetical protein
LPTTYRRALKRLRGGKIMSLPQLHAHIHASYHIIRRSIGILGFIFPLIFLVVGLFFGVGLLDSISSYYHTWIRDVYVGLLCTMGFLLHVYKGYSTREDWVLNLAGIFAFLTAILPTGAPAELTCIGFTAGLAHGICAILFFVCIAYVCIFLASETLVEMTDPTVAARYRLTYRILGVLMILLPLIASLISQYVFWVEFAAVWVFSTYWLIKCREMKALDAAALGTP